MNEPARVQLCGTFAVELMGRRIDNLLPGRQGRLLFAYLSTSTADRLTGHLDGGVVGR
jgi:hypothetical protein